MKDHQQAIRAGAMPIADIEAVIEANIEAARRRGMPDAAIEIERVYRRMEQRGCPAHALGQQKAPESRTATN